VGLIVPSSNVTMENELPRMMQDDAQTMSFHSARMVMRNVTEDELKAMNKQAPVAVGSLVDAGCDVLAYACLVAVMVQGPGAHRRIESELKATSAAMGSTAPIVSSAGALIDTLRRSEARKVAMVAPYMPALTETVRAYIEAEGVEVVSYRGLSVSHNAAVGCIPADKVRTAVSELDLIDVDALILSACVQMPSLGLIGEMQDALGVPVLTAASATAAASLAALGRSTQQIPGLAGRAWAAFAAP
jgi:maleate isomerase